MKTNYENADATMNIIEIRVEPPTPNATEDKNFSVVVPAQRESTPRPTSPYLRPLPPTPDRARARYNQSQGPNSPHQLEEARYA
ncbi:hypothetical protein BDN72DRAFT_848167 [Pluteus cervinus]|uniref:Uncharacterized protein n=1 Tax=Pluteus cervinus TaxID=181527 RepID=A0ACD3AAS8_9AGAR|nr:hypothetical protein BDN72DRAFT_848167 [Pluteus cervinus]